MRRFIGIDVGLDGAIAVLDEGGKLVALSDMPTLAVGKRRRYDSSEIRRRIVDGASTPLDEVCVTIEDQQAFPGQGVASMFSLGRGVGLLEGIVVGLGDGCSLALVRPQQWKKTMVSGLPKDKGASRLVAQRLWPMAPLGRKKDAGRAEALLIAEYGRRQLLGKGGGDGQ